MNCLTTYTGNLSIVAKGWVEPAIFFFFDKADNTSVGRLASCNGSKLVQQNITSDFESLCVSCTSHKWRSAVDIYTWTCLCWPTGKNLFTSALWIRDVIWKNCRRRWMRRMKRESKENPCRLCDNKSVENYVFLHKHNSKTFWWNLKNLCKLIYKIDIKTPSN